MPGSSLVVGPPVCVGAEPARVPAAGRPSNVSASSGGAGAMVAAIPGSSGAGGVLEAGGVDGVIVALVEGSTSTGGSVAFVAASTGGGVSVATVTSPLTVGIAPPQFPQKRCEASTGPPQCGHIILGSRRLRLDTRCHYGPNLEQKQRPILFQRLWLTSRSAH